MMARNDADDLYDQHYSEMKRRSHRRFRKLYKDIAADWAAENKVKKTPRKK